MLQFCEYEHSLLFSTSGLFRQGRDSPGTPLVEDDVTGLGSLLQDADSSLIDRFSPAVLKTALQSALPFRRLRCLPPNVREKILAALKK